MIAYSKSIDLQLLHWKVVLFSLCFIITAPIMPPINQHMINDRKKFNSTVLIQKYDILQNGRNIP